MSKQSDCGETGNPFLYLLAPGSCVQTSVCMHLSRVCSDKFGRPCPMTIFNFDEKNLFCFQVCGIKVRSYITIDKTCSVFVWHLAVLY